MRLFSTLLSAALLPCLARAAFHSNNTACTRHYTVQPGDTCDKIGQKTLTSTYQILAFNLLDAGADCYTLQIGSKLCLGRYGNDCQFVHQCTAQDTCESIANAYGISTQRLQNNNPSLDCNVVYDGLMLCVSAGSIRPPADTSINATDVKIAREHARQVWLLQERLKKPQTEGNGNNVKSKGKSTSKKYHAHPSSNSHSPHVRHHHNSQKPTDMHNSSKRQRSDLQQDVVESNAKHPVPKAERASPNPSEPQRYASSPAPCQQDSTAHDHTPKHDKPTSNKEPHSTLPSGQLDHSYIEDLFSATPVGSNHTPHHSDQHDRPQLAGATSVPQKRHRSLSSRSHQRSHTP